MDAQADLISQCYPNQIPDFVMDAMQRLHPGRYSSLDHFRVYGQAREASTYAAWRDSQPDAVLLYQQRGDVVRVLNEGISLAPDTLLRCARHLLQHTSAGAVLFRAVQVPRLRHSQIQQVACDQDSILALPDSVAAYRQRLGAATRATINNRLNRLRREQPTFQFQLSHQQRSDPDDVHALLQLHRQRIVARKLASPVDQDEEQRIQQMVQRCGMVGVARIRGRCAGGAIAYCHGAVASGRVLAHDNAYDSYRLGFLCAYLMACHCIEQGGLRQFHFGWGGQEYKFHLGAQERILSDVIVYRSPWQRLRLAPMAAALTARGLLFRLRRSSRRLR